MNNNIINLDCFIKAIEYFYQKNSKLRNILIYGPECANYHFDNGIYYISTQTIISVSKYIKKNVEEALKAIVELNEINIDNISVYNAIKQSEEMTTQIPYRNFNMCIASECSIIENNSKSTYENKYWQIIYNNKVIGNYSIYYNQREGEIYLTSLDIEPEYRNSDVLSVLEKKFTKVLSDDKFKKDFIEILYK